MSDANANEPPRAEIKKLPRSKCVLCGMEGVKPMVMDGRCVNERACQIRRERKRLHEAMTRRKA